MEDFQTRDLCRFELYEFTDLHLLDSIFLEDIRSIIENDYENTRNDSYEIVGLLDQARENLADLDFIRSDVRKRVI